MTLNDFIKQLQELQQNGFGNLPVYYRHGASGECGPLSSAFLDKVDRDGPFDLDEDQDFISIYAGN